MPDMPTADQIKGLVSLLAPGFIITSIRSRVTPGYAPTLPERLIAYGFISAAYFAAAVPLFQLPQGIKLAPWLHDFLEYFGAPSIIGLLWAYATQQGWEYRAAKAIGLQFVYHVPAAWDEAFATLDEGTFVLVTLADGTTFRGLMGKNSLASSNREERDILLEQVWTANDSGAWTELTPARSVLICGRDIRYVEIFRS